MPSQPKFRQTFEQQQAAQNTSMEGFQKQGSNARQENLQNAGQWGEDRANASQNVTDTNSRPVNQSGREVPMEDDTPRADPEKALQLN